MATATASELPIEEKERYTRDDYAELPEGAPYELIKGKLVMSPAPKPIHQKIAGNLYRLIFDHVGDGGTVLFSPIDVALGEDTVLQPDLIYLSAEREDRLGDDLVEGAPDLVIEILSPATAYRDLTTKKRLYEEHGVKEYWIVDPDEKMVEVYKNADDGFIQHSRKVAEGVATSSLLQDLKVDLTELFKS